MKGGANRKTTQQHIEDGTYRNDRHAEISVGDADVLRYMKDNLYLDYQKVRNELEKLDLTKPDDLDKYKQLNILRLDFVKAYHSIAKTPVRNEKLNASEKNTDGFK